ncbi:MAG: hypothetical protein ACPG8W_06260 [Candidatus Promineifilaceae bacterium]
MNTLKESYLNAEETLTSVWPSFLPDLPQRSFLEHVWVQPLQTETVDDTVISKTKILFDTELALTIPGLDAISLVLAPGGGGAVFPLSIQVSPTLQIQIIDLPIALRLKTDLFQPAQRLTSGNPDVSDRFEVDRSKDYIEIVLAEVTLTFDSDGNVSLETETAIDLPLTMLGDSGVVIEAENLSLHLSHDNPPVGQPNGWRGIYLEQVALYLPDSLAGVVGDLELTDGYIGNGGFSGTIASEWGPPLEADLGGMELGLQQVGLTFVQNALTESRIEGTLTLPFFDEQVAVEIGVALNGSLAVKLASQNGLITLNKPDLMQVSLENIGIELDSGTGLIYIGGKITPMFGGLDWPTFDIKKLSIDSDGNVKLDGGWLDLPAQYTLDFYGFTLEISKLGFGKSEDGGKWVGFTGGLKLVDGLSAGASVDGLRITWYDDGRDSSITLNGVGVEMVIPEVLSFKGEIAFRQFIDEEGAQVNRFDGAIKLDLITLGLEIDAVLVVGSADDPVQGKYTFFAIYLSAELPAGIPLWATGAALYGLAGLFALNFEPDKRDDEPWYGIGPGEGWYKRPEIGVTDLKNKWANEHGSLAIGGGITIGTLPDNGFTFSGKMLLMIVFPGPIVLLEGKANLLKARSKLDEEPLFRSLAVLDNRERTLLLGLDAQYKYGSGGELIDISGSAEAFFDFDDPSDWHLYLGQKEPRERRIRAEILSIYEANAYFMLDAHKLQMGAWVGYDKRWKFGPLRVTIEAWIEGNTVVSWRPAHFYGDLWMHGKAELSVFGFGLGLSADARIAADVFDPFHILGQLSVGINLPWPLPDFDVDIELEWGPEPDPPLLPKPLQEVAIEHFKVTTKWPLATGDLLLPSYDSNGDGLLDGSTGMALTPAGSNEPNLNTLPIVPLDARPHITFGRSVHDDALISVNPQPPTPQRERIGDPENNEGPVLVRYGLKEVVLAKRDGAIWQTVARKGDTANAADVPRLFGAWAPILSLPLPENFDASSDVHVNQTKLWLWSRTPYSYTRHTSDDLADWFEDTFESYPCIPDAPDRIVCCDFDDLPAGQTVKSPLVCREHRFIQFETDPGAFEVDYFEPAIDGHRHAICPVGSHIDILLRVPSDDMMITAFVAPAPPAEPVCVDFRDNTSTFRLPNPHKTAENLELLTVRNNGNQPSHLTFTNLGMGGGVLVNAQLHLTLPCPSPFAEVTVSSHAAPPEVVALNAKGQVVDSVQTAGSNGQLETIRLTGKGITTVIVIAPAAEVLFHAICFECPDSAEATWSAVGFNDNIAFPAGPTSGTSLRVQGDQMTRIRLTGTTRLCLVSVCINIGPDPRDVSRRIEMSDHMSNELARWEDQGTVLEPNTRYRIQIVTTVDAQGVDDFSDYSRDFTMTEFAYFQTEGAPGVTALSTPSNHPNPEEFQAGQGGLGDLTLYVDQTIPPTVPATGEKALLPRPVYRAYDVGVRFNEDYVDLMYRQNGRDLGLYLFDNNDQPVRDRFGRLLTLSNEWGVTEEVTLDGAEQRFVGQINASGCLSDVDISLIPHNQALAAQQLLDPDTVYEARLIPLLLHDDFGRYPQGTTAGGGDALGAWQVVDEGNNSAPSRWEVGESGEPATPHIVQTRNIWGGNTTRNGLRKPGTLLLNGENAWDDYRLSLFVRSADNDAVGVVFRYQNGNTFYRFSMDRQRAYRRLVRVEGGETTRLAEDTFAYERNRDYRLTVEALGDDLRIYQDGVLVFAVTDNRVANGRIGLYAWGNVGAQFKDVRVHDFRDNAPVVYRFPFTTSLFTDFFHHLHSYNDEVWSANISGANPAVVDATGQAISPVAAPPSEAESRAYAVLADLAVGSAAAQEPTAVEMTRITHNDTALGLLLRSPEPIDWTRVDISLTETERNVRPATPPTDLKITGATFGADQSVQLLARQPLNLNGQTLQYERWPTPRDQFSGDALFRDSFAENNFSAWTVVDRGTQSTPSQWQIAGGILRQTSNIWSPPNNRSAIEKRGTMALAGDAAWKDVLLQVGIQPLDNDAVGVVFRYQDADNFYRFSFDSERQYRRLVKNVNGVMTLLWEDEMGYEVGRNYTLTIIAVNGILQGFLDRQPLFEVIDFSLLAGRIGLYCWGHNNARFDHVWVDEVIEQPVSILLRDNFNVRKPDIWSFVAESARTEPAVWQVDGTLHPRDNAHPVPNTPNTGLYALAGNVDWQNYRLTTALRVSGASDETVGILFRYQDDDNYYRVVLSQHHTVRLERKLAGVVTVLATEGNALQADRLYQLAVECVGTELAVFIDGVPIATLQDATFAAGRVALYSGANTDVAFEKVRVIGRMWGVYHAFTQDELLPAGTQIVLGDSGGDLVITPADAPVLTAPTRLRWNDDGHEWTVLNSADFTPTANLRLLRKADGTGVFLLPSTLSSGQHRLTLTYRRDNTAVDTDSLILKEAGDSSAEQVELSINS